VKIVNNLSRCSHEIIMIPGKEDTPATLLRNLLQESFRVGSRARSDDSGLAIELGHNADDENLDIRSL